MTKKCKSTENRTEKSWRKYFLKIEHIPVVFSFFLFVETGYPIATHANKVHFSYCQKCLILKMYLQGQIHGTYCIIMNMFVLQSLTISQHDSAINLILIQFYLNIFYEKNHKIKSQKAGFLKGRTSLFFSFCPVLSDNSCFNL